MNQVKFARWNVRGCTYWTPKLQVLKGFYKSRSAFWSFARSSDGKQPRGITVTLNTACPRLSDHEAGSGTFPKFGHLMSFVKIAQSWGGLGTSTVHEEAGPMLSLYNWSYSFGGCPGATTFGAGSGRTCERLGGPQLKPCPISVASTTSQLQQLVRGDIATATWWLFLQFFFWRFRC